MLSLVRTVITLERTRQAASQSGGRGHAGVLPYGPGRMSAARELIAATAAALGATAFTVDELACAVRGHRPSTGVATVYRAVTAMESSGFLERVGERGGRALFARCATGEHHHHVVCTGCGAMVVTACPIGDVLTGAAEEAGFTVTGHDVRIYGLCRDCSPRARSAANAQVDGEP